VRKVDESELSGDNAPSPAADRRFESFRSTGESEFRARFGAWRRPPLRGTRSTRSAR
jgi:hypothetical protein